MELPPETKKISGDMLECFGNIKFTKLVKKEIIKKHEVKDDKMDSKFGKKINRGKKSDK